MQLLFLTDTIYLLDLTSVWGAVSRSLVSAEPPLSLHSSFSTVSADVHSSSVNL